MVKNLLPSRGHRFIRVREPEIPYHKVASALYNYQTCASQVERNPKRQAHTAYLQKTWVCWNIAQRLTEQLLCLP